MSPPSSSPDEEILFPLETLSLPSTLPIKHVLRNRLRAATAVAVGVGVAVVAAALAASGNLINAHANELDGLHHHHHHRC